MRRATRPLAAILAAFALATPARADASAARPLLIFAASSLAEAFTALAAAFAHSHPAATLEQSFAGSPALVSQVESGAPADVIATADPTSLQRLERAGLLADAPTVFARNRLEIVVERGNPKGVRGLGDLARADLVVILAGEAVPAGRYARDTLRAAGVRVEPRSLEENAKAVLNKVALGEADAGIVYATDVRAAGERVSGVEIPAAQNAIAAYPIARLKRADELPAARAFVAFVLSGEGQAILARFGFLAP